MNSALLADPDTLIARGGGWMRQYEDSASRGAMAPLTRLYANNTYVAFQIYGRFMAWFQSLTIDDPTRDPQGRLSLIFAWRDVTAVHLAKKSLVVYAHSGAAFCFATRHPKDIQPFRDLMQSLNVNVVLVRRSYTDFYRTTRRMGG